MAEQQVPEIPPGSEDLAKSGLESIIAALRDNTDPRVRQHAAYLLGQAKNPRAIQPLISALGDFDKAVREQATLALSAIGKAAIEPLSEALHEPRWITRYRAAEALGRIADEKAVKPLIQALKDNRDHVRYMAAKGLQEIGDSDAVEPLIVLLGDENRFVRMMAARCLGVVGGKNAIAALEAAVIREPDEKVREAIREALK
jgi:HEAT repeat protein